MKKFLFFLLFASAVSVNAQSFDETDLIGTWNTNGLAYAPYKITNIESITLGDCLYDYGRGPTTMCGFLTNTTMTEYDSHEGENTVTRDWRAVTDFFISNNNKLHIVQGDNFTLHFIIEELSATTLKVKTFDGQSYTFAKDNSLSAISVLLSVNFDNGIRTHYRTHCASDTLVRLSDHYRVIALLINLVRQREQSFLALQNTQSAGLTSIFVYY